MRLLLTLSMILLLSGCATPLTTEEANNPSNNTYQGNPPPF